MVDGGCCWRGGRECVWWFSFGFSFILVHLLDVRKMGKTIQTLRLSVHNPHTHKHARTHAPHPSPLCRCQLGQLPTGRRLGTGGSGRWCIVHSKTSMGRKGVVRNLLTLTPTLPQHQRRVARGLCVTRLTHFVNGCCRSLWSLIMSQPLLKECARR